MPFLKAFTIFFIFILNFSLSAQTWLSENCSTANGDIPPENWTSETGQNASPTEVWRWDNPGNRDIPMEPPFAIFDSDYYGSGILEEKAFWLSPIMDLSNANQVTLEFDHQFRYWENNKGFIQFSIGGEWHLVYTTPMNDVGFSNNPDSNTVIKHTIDLSLWLTNEPEVQIRFHYDGNWGHWWAIDNVKIHTVGLSDSTNMLSLVDIIPTEPALCWNDSTTFDLKLDNIGTNTIENTSLDLVVVLNELDSIKTTLDLENISLNEDEETIIPNAFKVPLNDLPPNLVTTGELEIVCYLEYASKPLIKTFAYQRNHPLPLKNEMYPISLYDEHWLNFNDLQVNGKTENDIYGDWVEGIFANDESHFNGESKKLSPSSSAAKSYWLTPFFEASENSKIYFDYAITLRNSSLFAPFDENYFFQLFVINECSDTTIAPTIIWEPSDTLGQQLIDLSAYDGELIRLAFFGAKKYSNVGVYYVQDFFVDNVQIFNEPYQDIGFAYPPTFAKRPCLLTEEVLQVELVNLGTESISINSDDFFQGIIDGEAFSLGANFSIPANDTIVIDLEGLQFDPTTFNLEIHLNTEELSPHDFAFNNRFSWKFESNPIDTLPIQIDFSEPNLVDSFIEIKENYLEISENPLGESSIVYDFDYHQLIHGILTMNPVLIEENTILVFDLYAIDFFTENPSWFQGTESFHITATTDCGLTYQELAVYDNQTEVFLTDTIDLSEFAGEELILSFEEKDIGDDVDFVLSLDNIIIKQLPVIDLALTELITPRLDLFCFDSVEPITFNIQNQGKNTIDFAEENATLHVHRLLPDSSVVDSIYLISEGLIESGKSLQFTLPETYDLSNQGAYQLWANLEITGDIKPENNSLLESPFYNIALDYDLIFGMDLNDFDGENLSEIEPKWQEKNGPLQPNLTSTSSAWDADFFSNDPTQENEIAAQINLWQDYKHEWLIGPKIFVSDTTHLVFDLALCQWGTQDAAFLGSDDTLAIMLSTDCGMSFNPVKIYNQNDSIAPLGQTEKISLIDYEGEEVIIAFYASEGLVDDTADVEIFIDNIGIEGLFLPPGDIAAIEVISPNDNFCEGEQSSVVIRSFNYSNRKLSNYFVVAEVSGAIDTVLIDTVTTPIEAMQNDLSIFQIYDVYGDSIFVNAYTILPEDIDRSNDTIYKGTKILSYPETNLVTDTIVCGPQFYLPNVKGELTNCAWSNGDTTHAVYIDETDLYILTAKNQTCTIRDSIYVEVLPSPQANFSVQQDELSIVVEDLSINNQQISWVIENQTFTENPSPYTFGNTGTYPLMLLATDSLCGTDTLIQQVTFASGVIDTINLGLVELNNQNAIDIYPNPSDGIIHLSFKEESNQPIEIKIYSVDGVLRKNIKTVKQNRELNLEDLNAGRYSMVISKKENDEILARFSLIIF